MVEGLNLERFVQIEFRCVETVSDDICYRPSKMISGEFDRIIDRVFLPLIGK